MARHITDEGGPAFPALFADLVDRETTAGGIHTGMSLRDWFAGQAMVGFISTFVPNDPDVRLIWDQDNRASVAWRAYAVADAMLKARKS
jgi:hypothetical protein